MLFSCKNSLFILHLRAFLVVRTSSCVLRTGIWNQKSCIGHFLRAISFASPLAPCRFASRVLRSLTHDAGRITREEMSFRGLRFTFMM